MIHVKAVFVSLLLFGVSCTSLLFAQSNQGLDTLIAKLDHKMSVASRAELLNEIAYRTTFAQPDEGIKRSNKALTFAQENQVASAEGEAFFNLGMGHSIRGRQDSAATYMQKAITVFQNIPDSMGMARSHNGLGNIYRAQGILPVALEHFLQSLQIKEAVGAPPIEIAGSYIGLGTVFISLEAYEKGIVYLKKALALFQELKSDKGIAASATNVAFAYLKLKAPQEAKTYLSTAFEAESRGGNKEGMAKVLTNQGNAYIDLKDWEKARSSYKQSIKIMQELGQVTEQASPLLGLAILEDSLQNTPEALAKAQLALAYARQGGMQKVESDALKILSELYASQNRSPEAFQAYKEHVLLRDSLLSQENQRKVGQLEAQYTYEKREKQLKVEQARREFALTQKLARQRFFQILSLVILAFLLTIAVIYYRYSRRLRQLNATKDKLFAIVAHDLKNPLSAFRSITQSLSQNIGQISQDEITYFLEKINKSSHQLYELLQNLLQWAISQTGQLDFKPQAILLSQASQQEIDALQTHAELKAIRVENQVSEGLEVEADPKMISLIIRNLLSNALKFSNPEGEVKLFSTLKNGQVALSIQDKGLGISPENQTKLFKIEEDVSKIGQSPEKGTGLGLILVKELVERQSGDVWVQSTPGQGSTFTFTLPKI